MSKEAMKQALDALEGRHRIGYEAWQAQEKAIAAQPEQEPEWYHFVRRGEDCFVPYEGQAPANATRLYTAPQPQRKPPEWYAQWIRNNYQDHPNIATLCEEMTKAAHGITGETK
jgi:hypothetical protein